MLNKVLKSFQFCIFLFCQVVDEQTSTVSELESKDNTQEIAADRTDSITGQDSTDHKTEIDNNASDAKTIITNGDSKELHINEKERTLSHASQESNHIKQHNELETDAHVSKSTPKTLPELSQELCNKNEVEFDKAHVEERQEGLVDEGTDMRGKGCSRQLPTPEGWTATKTFQKGWRYLST